MNPLTVKITHESNHHGTDIRRFTINDSSTLTWAALGQHVADKFDLKETPFKLTYVDDENDRITLSSDEELREAIDLARRATPAVLRLAVHVKKAKKSDGATPAARQAPPAEAVPPPPPVAPPPAAAAAAARAAAAGLPVELAPFLDTLIKQLPAAMEAMPEALRRMLPHAELDLPATIAANRAAASAGGGGGGGDPFCPADPHASLSGTPGVHEGVTCDKSGMCPIVGIRYHLVGHNYDLCQAEFDKLPPKEQALFRAVAPPAAPKTAAKTGPKPAVAEEAGAVVGIHPGVECDRSGMAPIRGIRYHLRGHNYDLCQAEFDKLPPADKAMYEAIPPPMTMGAGGAWRPGPCGWRARACGGAPGRAGAPEASHKLAARFVRDVTIFDGTQVPPGTPFTKIWRLKNVGEVAWPAGTRMLFVGGDQMTTEMSVPLSRDTPVAPGEEVDVAVEMRAPAEVGRYLGYWRLTGPHCRRKFGQRVWCHVQVVDPAEVPEAGLGDLEATLAEIERKKDSLTATEADIDADADADAAADAPNKAAAMADAVSEAAEAAPKPPPTADKVSPAAPSAEERTPPSEESDEGELIDAELASEAAAAVPAAVVPAAAVVAADPGPSGTAPAAAPSPTTSAAEAPPATEAGGTLGALRAMGFVDETMLQTVLAKNGDDLDACARDLAAVAEWEPALDDLEEMGFVNRELNKTLMLKHGGSIKKTVKDLVEA